MHDIAAKDQPSNLTNKHSNYSSILQNSQNIRAIKCIRNYLDEIHSMVVESNKVVLNLSKILIEFLRQFNEVGADYHVYFNSIQSM